MSAPVMDPPRLARSPRVAGESRALRGVRRYLRRELGLSASRYKAVGYWIERAEEWNQRYDALDEDTRRSLEAMWSEDRPEEDIESDHDERLAGLGLRGAPRARRSD